MHPITRDDLANELQQLATSFRESLQDSMRDALRAELPPALAVTRTSLHPSSPPSRNQNLETAPSPNGAKPVRSVEAQRGSRDRDLDVPRGPVFHKGFLAKKAYDEMASAYSLAEKPPRKIFTTGRPLPEGAPPVLRGTAAGDDDSVCSVDTEKMVKEGSLGAVRPRYDEVNHEQSQPPGALHDAWATDKKTSEPGNATESVRMREPKDLRTIGMMKKESNDGRKTAARLSSLSSMSLGDLLDKRSMMDKCANNVRRIAKRITNSCAFDLCSGLVIVLYTCKMGIQTDWLGRNIDEELPDFFVHIEITFCVLFSMELALRVVSEGKQFMYEAWNIVDSLLVFLQVLELVLQAVQGKAKMNMSYMRLLRILRVIRLARIVAVVRYLGEMRGLVTSILSSLKSLFFVLILLGILLFITGVFLMGLVSDALREDKDNLEMRTELKDWKSLGSSCLVLFQCLTGGIDWGDVSGPLSDHISPLLSPVFTLYIAFGVLCMLNVVTGVFVESATHSTAEEKDVHMVNRLQSFLCENNQDQLTWEDFESKLDSAEVKLYFQSIDLDVSEAHGLFTLLDTEDSGCVDAEEFVMGCLRLRGVAKAVDLASLMYENRRWHRRILLLTAQVEEHILDFSDRIAQVSLNSLPTWPLAVESEIV